MESKFTWFPKLTATCAKVPEEQRGKLLWALALYGSEGIEPDLEYPLNAIFESLRDDIDFSKRSINAGKKGGSSTKSKGGSESEQAPLEESATPHKEDANPPSDSEQTGVDESSKGGSEDSQANTVHSNTEQYKAVKREIREKRAPSRAFKPPTPEEVSAYCREKSIEVDAERFCDYYGAQGWKLSNGNHMRDWRLAANNWARRDRGVVRHDDRFAKFADD